MSDTASIVLILAVVALFEGVRRLPPDAFVLRKVFGRWNRATPLELGRDWFLVAWPIPVVDFVAVTPNRASDALGVARHLARLRARARRTRFARVALRVWGTLILFGLVVGVPLATLRWDAFGLVASVALLFVFCVVQAIVTHRGLRRAGSAKRHAYWSSLKMLWPFSAPCAAELVQHEVVRGAPAPLVLVELLGRERFLREMRTGLYDEMKNGGVNGVVATIIGRDAIADFLRRPADGATSPSCPRCGAQYRVEIRACANCEGVALIT
jgi:hypothetical protein